MPDAPAIPYPRLHALLPLVGDGATVAELERRSVDLGLTPDPGLAESTLAEAANLGLVRVSTAARTGTRYVLTSLGRRVIGGTSLSDADVDRLRDLEVLRTELSATIAHELRTPLTAIRTCASLLMAADANPTAEQHRTLVGTIERNAERMQRVVGDILDIARFRAGGIALQLRRFDAIDMARAVIASLAPVADRRGLRIELIAPPTAIAVFGDHRRLEQALVNLLANAQRFASDGGRVTVAVTTADGWLHLSVSDDGPGISEDDQARLFERFFVGRSDRGGPRDGVGLGLPTALAIAQAHGGRIDVDSTPGHGSTFTIVVPLDGPDAPAEVD